MFNPDFSQKASVKRTLNSKVKKKRKCHVQSIMKPAGLAEKKS